MKEELKEAATKNIKDILNLSIKHDSVNKKALVVYDTDYGLTDMLTESYKTALPNAKFIDFNKSSKELLIKEFDNMCHGDLVVLIQSSNFLLNEFRIRLHLFNKNLKVIEHMHLYRNTPEVWDVYINALEYKADWYPVVGPKLQNILATASTIKILSGDSELTITGGVEMPKLNIGDYTGMDNVGGTFPIGEVFTEAKNLYNVNGSLYIYCYAEADFTINMHTPFRIDIKDGQVVSWADDAPASFSDIISLIKTYERPLMRELGFGLNKALTRSRYLQDITAFERILGLHISLGEKHSVYKKQGMTTNKTRFHVDVFPVADSVYADDVLIFENGEYKI